ncbi:MAG: hypothetical protein WBD31_16370 [Rubripirellula sp.]
MIESLPGDASESNVLESVSPEKIQFDRVVLAHRMVQIAMFVGLVWKWDFFVQSAKVYQTIPLADDFFPALLRSATVVIVAFVAAIASLALNAVTASRPLQVACSVITFLASTVLCVHQGSYNDMTFVTTWWTSLWSLWFVWHMADADQVRVLSRGALLSRLIVSVILLGGGVGKWTAEYWSGEVFFDIYFRDRNFWVFNLLRENFDVESLHEMSKWYSRKVVIVETVAGLGLWLLPARWAAAAAVLLLASIALFSNFLLFSVLTSLIGLAAVGFFVAKPK